MSDVTVPESDLFVLRNPMRWAGAVVFGAFGVLAASLAILRSSSSWWERTVMGLIAVGAAVLAWRASRIEVICDPTGVTSTEFNSGHWGLRPFSWSQVERFEQRGLYGIGARLTDGRWVQLIFWATLGDVSQEKATAMLEDQRRLHQPAEGGSEDSAR